MKKMVKLNTRKGKLPGLPLAFLVKKNGGFTLVEMLVVVGIVVLLSGAILVNMSTGNRGIEVLRSAQTISSALRKAQNDALGSGEAGVYFTVGQNPIFFMDIDNNRQYDLGEEQKTIILDKNTELISFTPSGSSLHIFFAPPNPDVYINGTLISSDALVTVRHLSDASVIKTVRINTIGLISIE